MVDKDLQIILFFSEGFYSRMSIYNISMKKTLKLQIKRSPAILRKLGCITTGLYNIANYRRREQWKETGKIPSYVDQYRDLKENPLYRLLHSQVAQQTLKELDKSYKSWYSLRKRDDRANPPSFRKPRTPKSIWLTPAAFKIINDKEIRISVGNLRPEKPFEYIRVIPDSRYNIKDLRVKMINVVFEFNKIYACLCCEFVEPKMLSGDHLIGVDLGVNNLAALTSETGQQEIILGGELLSHQRYFNKKVGYLQSKLDKNQRKSTRAIRRLKSKQARQVKHKLHITTKYLAEKGRKTNSTIIVGDLNGFKRSKSKKKIIDKNGEVKKKRQVNRKAGQKIHSWSYATFTSLLNYKCIERGVKLIKVSERYTSRTCPACGKIKRSNRVKRGLYRCKCGYQCNADVNGAKNILLNFTKTNVSLSPVGVGVVVAGIDRLTLKFCNGILVGQESPLL